MCCLDTRAEKRDWWVCGFAGFFIRGREARKLPIWRRGEAGGVGGYGSEYFTSKLLEKVRVRKATPRDFPPGYEIGGRKECYSGPQVIEMNATYVATTNFRTGTGSPRP